MRRLFRFKYPRMFQVAITLNIVLTDSESLLLGYKNKTTLQKQRKKKNSQNLITKRMNTSELLQVFLSTSENSV